MKGRRHTPEQVVRKLREADRMLAEGSDLDAICRQLEALATPAARRITADDTITTLEQIVERRGTAPAFIRCDNGPELTAKALKDWCRFNNTTVAYIEPGAPWQNPYIESFNGHVRSELLDLESFNTLLEAQLLLDDWRLEYNHYRPHQSLNYQTPAAYARQWHADHDHRPS